MNTIELVNSIESKNALNEANEDIKATRQVVYAFQS